MAQTFLQKIRIQLEGADKASKGAKKVSKGMGDLAKKAMAAGAAYFGSKALIEGIKQSTAAFGIQEQAQRKLIKSTGSAATSLSLLASSLQKQTRFGDEATMAQMSFLGSIGMTEKQIKSIMPVAMDLAAATGMTLESAVRNTAKTFSGLAGELGELVPQLRELTAEEMKAGKAVEVMGQLFGGQAQADAASFTGKMEQLDNRLGDVAENFGSYFAPFVEDAKETWVDFSEAVSDFLGLTPDLEDAQREATQQLVQEKIELNKSTAALKLDVVSREEKSKIIKELNEKYGTRIDLLLDEKSSLEDIAEFQKQSNKMLQENINLINTQAAAQFFAHDIVSATSDMIDKRTKAEEKWSKRFKKAGKFDNQPFLKGMRETSKGIELLNKDISAMTDTELADFFREVQDALLDTPLGAKHAKAAYRIAGGYGEMADNIEATIVEIEDLEKKQSDTVDKMTKKQEEFNATYGESPEEKDKDDNKKIKTQEEFNEAKQKELDILNEKTAAEALLLEQELAYAEAFPDKAEKLKILNAEQREELKLKEEQDKERKKTIKGLDAEIAVLDIKNNMYSKSVGILKEAVAATGKNAKTVMHLQMVQATIDAWFASQTAFKQAMKNPLTTVNPSYPYIQGAAALAHGLSNVAAIKGATKAEEGFDGVVTEPTLILAGEAGPEYVDIEPTTNEGANRGGASIVFQGNVMSDNFIEEEAIPKIKEALRRGADIGVS